MTRSETWNGIAIGDLVRVAGLRGDFRFCGHVTATAGEWVDLFGGTPGRERFRSVAPDRVKAMRGRRARQLAAKPRAQARKKEGPLWR